MKRSTSTHALPPPPTLKVRSRAPKGNSSSDDVNKKQEDKTVSTTNSSPPSTSSITTSSTMTFESEDIKSENSDWANFDNAFGAGNEFTFAPTITNNSIGTETITTAIVAPTNETTITTATNNSNTENIPAKTLASPKQENSVPVSTNTEKQIPLEKEPIQKEPVVIRKFEPPAGVDKEYFMGLPEELQLEMIQHEKQMREDETLAKALANSTDLH